MSNYADTEALSTWRVERPERDRQTMDDFLPVTYPVPAIVGVCTCTADPAHDPNHSCVLHPPF